MEQILAFVQEWGYLAVFLGSLVEGESVILTASAMAYLGYLDLYKIMTIAFCTTLFVDQALFYVGRYYGPSFFDKRPKLRNKAEKAFNLLHRFDIWFILSFRFIYGIRTISPIVIGAAGISPKRYSPLNFLAAIIWTVLSCYTGYALGDILEEALNNMHLVQKFLTYGFVTLIVIAIIFFWWRKWRANKSSVDQE